MSYPVAGIFPATSATKEISASYGAETREKTARWALIDGVIPLITRLMPDLYLVTHGCSRGRSDGSVGQVRVRARRPRECCARSRTRSRRRRPHRSGLSHAVEQGGRRSIPATGSVAW